MDQPTDEWDMFTELLIIVEGADSGIREAVQRLNSIRHRLINPNMPRQAHGFGHRVYEVQKNGEQHLCALASNVEVARAAFDKLVEIYPHREWVLRWGMMKPAHYVPPDGQVRDPVPPRIIG